MMPDVVWECEYPSGQARKRDDAAISGNPAFQRVEQPVETLFRRFAAGTFVQHRSSCNRHRDRPSRRQAAGSCSVPTGSSTFS